MRGLRTTVVGLILALGMWMPTTAPAQDHAGHDHGKTEAGHGHGTAQDLGTTTVAGLKITVAQMGEVKKGGSGVFEVIVSDQAAPKPKAVRAWVGTAGAEGSVKGKGAANGNVYDVHVEIPATFGDSSKLWVEIEPATGKKEKASFDLKR